jgi:hypothetical protein
MSKGRPSRRAKADPIYALIAKHIEAVKAGRQAIRTLVHIPGGSPEYKGANKVVRKTGERSRKLLMKLLCAEATTLEGVAALLEHLGRPEFLKEDPKYPHARESLLSSMNEYSSHEWKRHGQDFPLRVAATLRSLIAARAATHD